jgi:hypothetical protein
MLKEHTLAKIMTTPIADDMDPIQRVWLEMKKKITQDRDVWFTDTSQTYL